MNPTWEKIQTLRDEVRLKLHLAGMDARDEFDKIEAQLPSLQKDVEGVVSGQVKTTLDDVIRQLEKLRASLDKK